MYKSRTLLELMEDLYLKVSVDVIDALSLIPYPSFLSPIFLLFCFGPRLGFWTEVLTQAKH